MSTRLALALAVVAVPSVALAQPADPPPGPAGPPPPTAPVAIAPPAATPEPAGPADAWQMQARLPTTLGVDSLINPGFSIGHRSGNIVIAAEIGATAGKLTTDSTSGSSTSDSLVLLQVLPMVYFDMWHSRDGRARMNLLGGLGIGRGSVTSSNTDTMNLTSSSTTSLVFMPILAGIGGDYYLSPNFAIGVELSAEIPVVLSVSTDGTDQKIGGALESMHGMIRFTFVAGD